MNESIDFVVTWVDDTDPKWLSEKEKYQKVEGHEDNLNGESRYRNFDLFRYWFRAVEKYAPWVHKVFLITNGQVPSWLNKDYEKLILINHEEYIPAQYLPTFNSNVIELNINRISQLSQNFVLFNDDTFLNGDTKPTDFFLNDVPRDAFFETPIIPATGTIAHTMVNDMSIINDSFDKRIVYRKNLRKIFNLRNPIKLMRTLLLLPSRQFCGIWNSHLPISYRKETLNLVWNRFGYELNKTNHNRFRTEQDYNHWLFRYWQLLSGEFVPRNVKFGQNFNLTNDNLSLNTILTELQHSKHKLICINDTDDLKDASNAKKKLAEQFSILYPNKSLFEN